MLPLFIYYVLHKDFEGDCSKFYYEKKSTERKIKRIIQRTSKTQHLGPPTDMVLHLLYHIFPSVHNDLD